jgi:hypothetical protein
MKSLKDEEKKEITIQAARTTAIVVLPEVPSLLLVLESCFLDDVDCSYLLFDVPVNVLMRWESEYSAILRDGLEKMNWWEKHCQQFYPTTYERLLKDMNCCWRKLIWMLWRADHLDHRVWKETIHSGLLLCWRFTLLLQVVVMSLAWTIRSISFSSTEMLAGGCLCLGYFHLVAKWGL